MKKVLLLFGGCSGEHRVSLASAAGVLEAMEGQFEPMTVGITREGRWYHCAAGPEAIRTGAWLDGSCAPAVLSPDRGDKSLLVFRAGGVGRIAVDCVFPVLHGRDGEDGTVQGLCQLAGLPVAGCGVLASALCMDKVRAHKLVEAAGIPVPRSFTVGRDYDREAVLRGGEELAWPVFVKPVRSGSSLGVSRADGREALLPAIEEALRFDREAVVEQTVPGFEVGCAVMGNDRLITGELDEVELAGGFFDYREKYDLTTARLHVPARIPAAQAAEIKWTARTIYRVLGCRGFARVDMFLTPEGQVVFNEVNTIPGFTVHSRFPAMMAAAGMDMRSVVALAVALAGEGEP